MTAESPFGACQKAIFSFKRVLFRYTDTCSELCRD